ncbi:MAG: hypothetical protein ACXVXB_02845 [Nocardioidaceae bacterium]
MTAHYLPDGYYWDEGLGILREPGESWEPWAAGPDNDTAVAAAASRPDRFRGINWLAAFFGWWVAVSWTALLAGAVGAVLAERGDLGMLVSTDAAGGPGRPALVSVALALALLLVGYFTGGYVAGRMSRYDGGRQGLGLWFLGLLLPVAAGALLLRFHTPVQLPDLLDLASFVRSAGVDGRQVVLAAGAGLLALLLAAVAGGKVGCRYHRKVDAAATIVT